MKPIYASKTFWFNIFAGALLVLEAQLGALTAVLPAHFGPWVLLVIPLANVVLRAITTEAVKIK